MSDHDWQRIEGLPDLKKSIFPTFDVNVPMPSDTAVPGSYVPPAPQNSNAGQSSGKEHGQ